MPLTFQFHQPADSTLNNIKRVLSAAQEVREYVHHPHKTPILSRALDRLDNDSDQIVRLRGDARRVEDEDREDMLRKRLSSFEDRHARVDSSMQRLQRYLCHKDPWVS